MRASLVVAALAAALTLSLPVHAQVATVAEATTGTATAPISDLIAVPVWPKAVLPLPEQPVATSFNLGQIEGVAPSLVAGVTANGYARKVAVEDQTVGQVLVVSVAKGDRVETISTEGLTAQFDAAETSQLFPEKTVEVKGSKSALIAALERLAQPAEKAEEKQERDPVTDNAASAGQTPSNSEAASYRTPTVSTAPATEDDPVTDYRTTTEGCPVRIDLLQEKAVVQSKEQVFTDGALSDEGDCTDSEISYPLKKSYPSCPTDDIDLKAMTARPQFQRYYIDEAGENHPVGECLVDEDTTYTITEDETQCPVSIDFLEKKAVPQSAFVYIGRNNALTQVPGKGCAASTKTAAVELLESACPMRHELSNNLSYELSMWTYVLGGVTYQAAPCANTGRTFGHEIVYADAAGNYICPGITNLKTRKVTLQSRRRIVVDGTPQWVNDCTPDTSTQDILATTDTCKDPSKWTHDLDLGISYGQERFYYPRVDGTPEYVTPCQDSAAIYPHDVEITGYQYHDDQLWAYALSTVTIDIAGTPYTVVKSTVLPGTAQWEYVLNGTVDQPTGKSSYEGCKAYRETARYEKWERPDGSEFLKEVGAGEPKTVDVCSDTIIASQYLQTGRGCQVTWGSCDNADGRYGVRGTFVELHWDWFETINKVTRKNLETGEDVTTTCKYASGAWKAVKANNRGGCTSGSPLPGCPYDGSVNDIQTLFIPPCPF